MTDLEGQEARKRAMGGRFRPILDKGEGALLYFARLGEAGLHHEVRFLKKEEL